MKKNEFINSIRGEHSWIKMSPEETYKLAKALGELDSFVAEKKSILKPLSEIEINGLFLYLTQYSDKPIIELEYEEKREIVRDHIEELKEIDAVTDKEIERVNLSAQITSTEPVFKVSLLKDALLAHFV